MNKFIELGGILSKRVNRDQTPKSKNS